VLVLYMASRYLPTIAKRLVAAGRSSNEPVAIISKATTAAQSVLVSTLGEIVEVPPAIQAPAIIVIGEVVRLRPALDWLSALEQQYGKPP
jgi:uroporphyrin-III C-methyltransferase